MKKYKEDDAPLDFFGITGLFDMGSSDGRVALFIHLQKVSLQCSVFVGSRIELSKGDKMTTTSSLRGGKKKFTDAGEGKDNVENLA